jgi:hypothetical protein
MKRTTFALFTLAALASASLAQQEGPSMMPDPQVQKFAALIGDYQGNGTVLEKPGAQPTKWTATGHTAWILGGHFVQEDQDIQTSMGTYSFRTIYGWDRENARPICYGVTNMGPEESEIAWIDDKTLVSVHQGTRAGVPYVDRWTMKLDEKGYAFSLDRAMGDSPAFNHVQGRYDRVTKAAPVAAVAYGPAPAEMKALQPLIGDWHLTGKIDMPGMAAPIAGNETIEWLYGGAVLAGHVQSEPQGGYEGIWFICYDQDAKCYRHLFASDMGEVGMPRGDLVDGDFVITDAAIQFGQPSVYRSVIDIADGGIARCFSDRIMGTGATVRSFEATYERAGAKKTIEAKFTAGSCCAKALAAGSACAHPCCVEAAKAGKICEKCNN